MKVTSCNLDQSRHCNAIEKRDLYRKRCFVQRNVCAKEKKECCTEGAKYRLPACCDKIIKLFIPVGSFHRWNFFILFVEAAFVSLFACV